MADTAPDKALHLTGYRHSVYTWIVRMMLAEVDLTAGYAEVDPFARPLPAWFTNISPFGRVPVLRHGDFVLYETAAITGYLETLAPLRAEITTPRAQARLRQVIGIVDAQAYPVLVRQVFSHGWFRPRFGEVTDARVLQEGLDRAPRILSALDDIAQEGQQLSQAGATRADLHLAPMLDYFARVPEGARMLGGYPALDSWLTWMRAQESFRVTDPFADRMAP